MKEFKGKHNHFGVPVFRVSKVQDIVPDATPSIYELPIGEGMVLTVMARVVAKSNQSLTVVSHGAKEPMVGLPYFNRFSSLLKTDRSFLLLSDPTLTLDESMTLAWYLGNKNIDPLDTITELVNHIAGQRNIERILFEGSSGGGFSSLRLAARFPDSVALVFSPQTNAFNYETGSIADRIKSKLFDGHTRSDVLTNFPDRFSVVDLYARTEVEGRRPFLYYVQNSGDVAHVRLQMDPFLDAIAEGSAQDHSRLPANVHVAMLNQGPGHIRPTLQIWEEHEEVALRILDGIGIHTNGKSEYSASSSSVITGAKGVRNELRSWHLKGSVEFTSSAGRRVSTYIRGESLAPTLLRVFMHPPCNGAELTQTVLNSAPETPAHTLDVYLFDEMILDFPELSVAWFVGTREHQFINTVSDMITNIERATLSRQTLLVGASSGGFAALMLKTKLRHAHVLAFSPDVSIQRYSAGHRDRFLTAGGYQNGDRDGFEVANRLDLTVALSTNHLISGPKPKVFLNPAATNYEFEQLSYLKAQTLQDTPVDAWAALGVDAEYIEYASNIQRPAPSIYLFELMKSSEQARA